MDVAEDDGSRKRAQLVLSRGLLGELRGVVVLPRSLSIHWWWRLKWQ